ncbi:hypothetical protein EBR37_03760 [bacterium]|nr:hypothetical protein [bacterium]
MEEITKDDYWEVQADMWYQNYKEADDEIKRLQLLVHYAFCEGQITPFLLEDWINSRSYAALKEGTEIITKNDDGHPDEQQEWHDFDPDC